MVLYPRHVPWLSDAQEPFRKPYGWAAWALLGVALSPFVVGTVATVVSLVGYDESVGGRGTVDGVAGMIQVRRSAAWARQHKPLHPARKSRGWPALPAG